MASTKNASKGDDPVAEESARLDEALAARHDRKVALIEGDSDKAADLTETAQGSPVAVNDLATPATDTKKGDA